METRGEIRSIWVQVCMYKEPLNVRIGRVVPAPSLGSWGAALAVDLCEIARSTVGSLKFTTQRDKNN